jgi:hypothetical protein
VLNVLQAAEFDAFGAYDILISAWASGDRWHQQQERSETIANGLWRPIINAGRGANKSQ